LLDGLFEQPGIKKKLPAHFSSLYVPVVPLSAALLEAVLSSLKLTPLFVAEREQTLELVNRWNVQFQDPTDSGCSRGAKKIFSMNFMRPNVGLQLRCAISIQAAKEKVT
jgi:hypothetical protein